MSAHGGRIIEDMPVGLERPRVQREQTYHEYCDRLIEMLRIAIPGTLEVAEPKGALALVKS